MFIVAPASAAVASTVSTPDRSPSNASDRRWPPGSSSARLPVTVAAAPAATRSHRRTRTPLPPATASLRRSKALRSSFRFGRDTGPPRPAPAIPTSCLPLETRTWAFPTASHRAARVARWSGMSSGGHQCGRFASSRAITSTAWACPSTSWATRRGSSPSSSATAASPPRSSALPDPASCPPKSAGYSSTSPSAEGSADESVADSLPLPLPPADCRRPADGRGSCCICGIATPSPMLPVIKECRDFAESTRAAERPQGGMEGERQSTVPSQAKAAASVSPSTAWLTTPKAAGRYSVTMKPKKKRNVVRSMRMPAPRG